MRVAKELVRETTGKEATQVELRKIAEVLEVVMLEGKIAAARTTVSSASPFLAEHLRRRLCNCSATQSLELESSARERSFHLSKNQRASSKEVVTLLLKGFPVPPNCTFICLI